MREELGQVGGEVQSALQGEQQWGRWRVGFLACFLSHCCPSSRTAALSPFQSCLARRHTSPAQSVSHWRLQHTEDHSTIHLSSIFWVASQLHLLQFKQGPKPTGRQTPASCRS